MNTLKSQPRCHIQDIETEFKKEFIEKPWRDFIIYGNSIQDGTPSPENPVEIKSVGERTKNLWGKETTKAIDIVNLTHKWDDEGGLYFYNIGTVSKTLDTELTLPPGNYSISSPNKVVYIYINGGSAIAYNVRFKTISLTEESVVKIRTFNGAGETTYLQYMVVEGEYTEDTMPEFEPQGYKIPIEIMGKNLFDETKLIDLGFELQEDGRYYDNSTNSYTIWENTEGIQGSINIRAKIEYETSTGFAIRTFYTDGTSKWSEGITDATKNVDYISFVNARKTPTWISNILITTDITSDEYEPYIEPKTYNIYLDEPLRRCGSYADYIDVKEKKLVRRVQYYDSITDAKISARWVTSIYSTIDITSAYYYQTWGSMPMNGTNYAPLLSNNFTSATVGEPGLDSRHFQRSTKYNSVYQKIPIFYFEDFAGLERGSFINLTTDERSDLINDFMTTNNVDCQVGLVTQIEQDIKLPDIQLHNGTIVAKINTEIQPWKFKCSKYQ